MRKPFSYHYAVRIMLVDVIDYRLASHDLEESTYRDKFWVVEMVYVGIST